MKNLPNRIFVSRFLQLTILVGYIFGAPCCANSKKALALYDGGIVSTEDFLNNYNNYLRITGIKDNMVSRKLVLENVINEKIILSEFNKTGLERHPSFVEKKNIIYEQLLLDKLFEEKVLPKVQFSNAQLARYFTRENTIYHIKQVFADNYDSAMVYYRLLYTDVPIENIMNRLQEPGAKYDLGFVTLKDIHPQFREAIENLQPREVSHPLKGIYGYTVLILEDKRVTPLLTEYEFAKQKKVLSGKMAIEYQDSIKSDYARKMARSLKIKWHEDNLTDLLNLFRHIRNKSDLPLNHDDRVKVTGPVCSVKNIAYDFSDLLPLILKSRDAQLKAVRDENDIKDFIAGIIVREQLIMESKKAKYDHQQDFKNIYSIKLTKLKIDSWTKNYSDTICFGESDYQLFYNQDSTEYFQPNKRNVYQICVPEKEIAKRCMDRIQNGEEFQQIAAEYSQYHQNLKSDGSLGILTSSDLGKFGAIVFSAPLETVVGPVQYGDKYYLFLSTKEYPGRILSQSEAMPMIEERHRQDLVHSKMQEYFALKSHEYHVTTNIQLLKSIKYQDSGAKRGRAIGE